jgi:hypothetical protein
MDESGILQLVLGKSENYYVVITAAKPLAYASRDKSLFEPENLRNFLISGSIL